MTRIYSGIAIIHYQSTASRRPWVIESYFWIISNPTPEGVPAEWVPFSPESPAVMIIDKETRMSKPDHKKEVTRTSAPSGACRVKHVAGEPMASSRQINSVRIYRSILIEGVYLIRMLPLFGGGQLQDSWECHCWGLSLQMEDRKREGLLYS